MAKTLLFVYGTLKRGGSNFRLMGNSKFVAEAKLGPGRTLYTNGSYPMMVESDEGEGVVGEVFEVEERTLASLDRFEGHPNLFKRTPVEVAEVAENIEGPVYAYAFQRPVGRYDHLGTTFTEDRAH